ncbi:MAG: alkaline phosphatase family protein [Actinomycetia bacterium]|nr:alkaline phosphatase family protein [Actinomycetes bacterium]
MSDSLPPPYGAASLAEILPAVAAHVLTAPDRAAEGARDVLGLPPSRRYVVCLVDGLGTDILHATADEAPVLAAALGTAIPLSSTHPSTTATAITTLSTGTAPGRHGIVGYSFRSAPGRLLNALTWAGGPRDPVAFQPVPTWWERLAGRGVATSAVAPEEFMGTGLTRASLRGARFVPVADERDSGTRIAQAVAASARGEASLVYVYERSLDRAGHTHGWRSPQWRQALAWVDGLVGGLRASLDPDVCLLVTGDHGMVDVPADRRIVLEDEPRLVRDVALVGGEARCRFVYTDEPERVAAAWAAVLGERALVVRGDDAIEDGWFDEVPARLRSRIGDVVAVLRQNWALTTRTVPGEARMVGMHGGATRSEMGVPLLIDPGGGSDGGTR